MPAVRPAVPPNGNIGGTKRKAEDSLPRPPKPETKIPSRPVISKPTGLSKPDVPSTAPGVVLKPLNSKQIPSRPVSSKPSSKSNTSTPKKPVPPQKMVSRPAPAAVQSKPPPKGSFAAIMEQAKAAQDKAPVQLGVLKHQAESKERLSKVERKRRVEEEAAKQKAARLGKKAVPVAAGAAKDKSARRRDSDGPSYKGTAKPTQTPEPPTYRGTAGKPSSRGPHDRRHQSRNSRQNEYLGTDEEDEGDGDGHGYDDYYSDESSDMEAGLDDVDREEAAALRFAKREDEEDMRQEMAAKKAKLERQRKLAALASKKR